MFSPGGKHCRKSVDLLTKEVCRLNQNECSERLLVFSRLILQRDPMIKSTGVVRALIGRRLEDWEISNFKILLQEPKRCSQKQPRKPMKKNRSEDEHTAMVFARMMMEGKVRSAMRWLTSRSGGGLLCSMQMTKILIPQQKQEN